MKVLFDTDIGSDIDDAVCLAYLLANPACDLLGITTVTGQPEKRAQLASALCLAAGREDIPIYPGAPDPLLVAQRQPEAQQAAALARWPHRETFPRGEAVEFMRRTIRAHPGEVTLLTVGPLTNLGLLFRTDPEIPGLLKRLVMMAGHFTGQAAGSGHVDWNSICDPHAAAIAYQAPAAVHRSVGLDVTTKVVLPAAEVRARFSAPLLRPVLDFAEIWFAHAREITFHDPLAAVSIFDEAVCGFKRGRVEIELASPRLEGYTHWSPEPGGPHEVALKVDPGRFFEQFFGVFAG
ncbi:MAG: nucleoside hydrolase [Anaerolineaceae bacterium]|nr:nucleoside hydrolase [Anaerolineaceae bacterium]